MAYNPFSAFRRYKQTGLVALTIMCMFIFVLSSGVSGGDFFDQMGRAVGNRSAKEAIGSLNGSTIDTEQLRQVMQRRKIANLYMSNAVSHALNELIKGLNDSAKKLDAADRGPIDAYFQNRMLMNSIFSNPQFSQNREFLTQFAQRERQVKEQLRSQLRTINRDDKKELYGILDKLIRVLDAEAQRQSAAGSFFGGAPGGAADALEFMVWLHYADQMGIRLTGEDVKREIQIVTLGGLSNTAAKQIETQLGRQYAGVTPNNLLTALGDEFRVRLTQTVMCGSSDADFIASLRAMAGMDGERTAKQTLYLNANGFAPYDAWQFFKENRTQITLTVLPISTESLLAQVTAQPSDEDLKKLYDAGKNLETIPGEETPGFKRVRQAKIEFLSIRANLPYYRKLAAIARALHPLTGIGHVVNPDALNIDQSSQFLSERERDTAWNDHFLVRLLHTSYWNPEPLAALVAESASIATMGNPLMALTTGNQAHALMLENRHRARVGSTIVAGLAPAGFPMLGLPFAVRPTPVPLSAFQPLLNEAINDKLAIDLLGADLEQFAKKVEELGKKADKAEVRKYIDEFAKERGITVASSALVDHHSLPNDPALKPLRDRYTDFEAISAHSPSGISRKPSEMYTAFFPGPGSSEKSSTLFAPKNFPNPQQKPAAFLRAEHTYHWAWKTEEIEPKQLTFEEAKPTVVNTWKMQEARKLAKTEADKLAEQAKALKGNIQALRDLAASKKITPFDLGPMAKMNPQQQGFGSPSKRYVPYQVPADKIEYPPLNADGLVTTLFSVQDKAEGEAVVTFTDRPKNHFYVAVRTFKSEPSMSEFGDSFRGFAPGAILSDSLLKEYDFQQAYRYRSDLHNQLRQQAKLQFDQVKLGEMERNLRE